MKPTRLTSLVILGGLLAGGLVLQAADDEPPAADLAPEDVLTAGIALPASAAPGTLGSTWYCAGGPATEADGHVVVIANPTDRPLDALVTALPGLVDDPPAPATTETTAEGETTTTTEAPTEDTTTTTAAPLEPVAEPVEVPAQGRVAVDLFELVEAPLAGAVVEVDGAPVAVEHSVTGAGGRATAPCSSTTSTEWAFPWGVTSRGARELLVFMNPFPKDATVDIEFATDEGVRETLRFQGFVVPARSVVGAYIDESVQRNAQVSAQVRVRPGQGRVVVDRIQTFDGTDAREGITLGLGQPTPSEVWFFPDGRMDEGVSEQVVVFNSTDEVAEVEVEVRLADPEENPPPEPFELTIPPSRYEILALEEFPDRVPSGVSHHLVVRSLNGVPVTAERVIVADDPSPTVGVSATSGAPLAASTWYFAAGGVNDERDEWITVVNASLDAPVTLDVTGLADGQTVALADLQGVTIEPGARLAIQISEHSGRDDQPLVLEASGPIYAERGLFRIDGRGISQSMGIPLAVDVFRPDPVDS